MRKDLLSRREFGAYSAALGLSLPASGILISGPARAQAPDAGADAKSEPRTVKIPNGTVVPALGQGSWHLGQGRHRTADEEEAMRTGISLGLTVIDTSRNYGEGRSERFVGRVIAGQRDKVFLITKVQSDEIVTGGFTRALDRKSTRLNSSHVSESRMPSSA